MKSSGVLLALVVSASFGCRTSPVPPIPPIGPAQRNVAADGRCEIVVLGVFHEYMGEGYRPAHLRAFYQAVRPTALAIESSPSAMERGELSQHLNENYEALEYARVNGIPVYGVDWEWPRRPATGADAPPRPRPAGLSAADLRRLQRSRSWEQVRHRWKMFAGARWALQIINSPPFQESLRSQAEDIYPGWEEVNDTIVANIRAAARNCVGGRLLVSYGALHKPFLDDGLARAPEFRLRQPSEWLPLDESDLTAHEKPSDLLQVLLFNFESLFTLSNPAVIPRRWVREQLPRLEERALSDPEARYYLARWLTLEGDWRRAAALLQTVADEAGDRELWVYHPRTYQRGWFWPPEPNLRRRALFSLALVHDLAGERDSALAIYRLLRDELMALPRPGAGAGEASVQHRLIPWLDLFLEEPFTGHPDQYLKGSFGD